MERAALCDAHAHRGSDAPPLQQRNACYLPQGVGCPRCGRLGATCRGRGAARHKVGERRFSSNYRWGPSGPGPGAPNSETLSGRCSARKIRRHTGHPKCDAMTWYDTRRCGVQGAQLELNVAGEPCRDNGTESHVDRGNVSKTSAIPGTMVPETCAFENNSTSPVLRLPNDAPSENDPHPPGVPRAGSTQALAAQGRASRVGGTKTPQRSRSSHIVLRFRDASGSAREITEIQARHEI